MVRIATICLLLAATMACVRPCPAQAQVEYVPLQFRTLDGIRPFVPVQLNGHPFLFMVHSNASFYAQTTHGNAALAGITVQSHDAAFGIDKPGHVSSLGLTKTTAQSLTVGPLRSAGVPLSIFEVPVPDMDGMLGIAWLRDNGVIVDYDRQRVGFAKGTAEAKQEDERLLRDGFVAHAMTWDENSHRYFVAAGVNGVAAHLVVSTVSSNILDKSFVERAGISLGPVVYLDSGPGGAQVSNYLSKRAVMITVDNQRTAWTQPIVQDTYAYSSTSRPAGNGSETNGYLGCDFMLANEAVIDFRSGTLFLRPQIAAQRQ